MHRTNEAHADPESHNRTAVASVDWTGAVPRAEDKDSLQSVLDNKGVCVCEYVCKRCES